MENIEIIARQIAEAVAARPIVPADRRLWDAEACADYLCVNKRAFLERWAPLPSFPVPIRIELADGKRCRPRWKASEVMAWAERQRDGGTPKSRHAARK